jgi:ATP-dependent DNA helicase RecG
MMANLTQILKSGESETAEFKENFDKETIETVGAFSNTRGGCILIGVKNDSRVIGVNVSIETLKDWSNIISQVSEPTVIPEIREDRINEKRIIVIQIPEYPLKPVAIRGRCFRRVATSNRQMSPQEIAQMHLLATGNSWDALAARENSLDAIDIEKVEKYLKVSTANGRKNSARPRVSVKSLTSLS